MTTYRIFQERRVIAEMAAVGIDGLLERAFYELEKAIDSLVISLEAIERSLSREATAVRKRLARTRILTEQTIADVRRLIADLRPGALDELGLVAAIRWCAENHLEPLGVAFNLQADDLAHGRLPEELETVLCRIAQEAIGNIARHAGAHRVNMHLSRQDGQVRLVIEDDGEGFDPDAVQPARDGTQGLGLAGMRERASLVGGQVRIRSRVNTAQTHRQNIMDKLDLHNKSELTKYAIRKGLITVEP